MCGLAGVLGSGDVTRIAERLSDAIRHRGPDDAGQLELRDKAGEIRGVFTHRRLAIIDLSPAGHQPMCTADGRLAMIFNGEIYNYRELQRALRLEGARFRSDSDTEVILEGWARHGPDFLRRLRGMFALAIWDRTNGAAYLARDAFGIKPMYYASGGGRFAFASEVRALLASRVVSAELSPEAVASYLSAGSVQEPLSLVRGIVSLPAGTFLRIDVSARGAIVAEPVCFDASLATDRVATTSDRGAAAILVREALRDSVAHHLVSDVPVACFLSGGIDSSIVVALAAELSARPLETFTVVFGEREYSELGPARALAQRFGTDHTEVPLTAADLFAALPHAFASMDQPSMDGLNTYVVSRAVRERGIKVVLSGLGGDEMFAGYPSFARARQLARLWRAGAPLRRLGAAAMAVRGGMRAEKLGLLLREPSPARAAFIGSRALFAGAELRRLAGRDAPDLTPEPPPGLSLLQQVSWYELTGYMRSTLLRDSDVFSMAHALELRVPFVDRGVAAASLQVADALKLRRGRAKPVLVDAMRDLLPVEVWDRPKQGFTLPFDRWMRQELRREVHSAFTDARLSRVGMKGSAARDVWEGFLRSRPGYTWSRPWAIYTLVRWAEQLDLALPNLPVRPESAAELALR
jgi:asparagine synthase (glutamine-hydrolysing)